MKSQFCLNGFFEKTFKNNYNDEFFVGRIVADLGNSYKLITQDNEFLIDKLINERKPVVGDYVVFKKNNQKQIVNLLPRLSTYENIDGKELTCNFDTIFIVNSLTNLNVKKIEKTVLQAWESGAVPVVVLTKRDLCEDFHNKVAEVKLVAAGVDVFPVSAVTSEGIDEMQKYLKGGNTIAILGSKGEGKSTLINKLANDENLRLNDCEMFILPNGSMIIDIDEEKELNETAQNEDSYHDIEDLVLGCRFTNCTHTKEPGCAVIKAIENGSLDENRLNKYLKLQKKQVELSLDETIRFDYNKKRPKELYNKGRRKEQW